MSNPYVGEIRLFAGNYAPAGWAFCNGSLQSIADNTTLYSLLGTTYGGDGQTTFGLPDFRGRIPIHQGTGSGLTTRTLGERAGTEAVTLTLPQIPAHSHTFAVSGQNGTLTGPGGNVPAAPDLGAPSTTASFYVNPGAQTPTLVPMAPTTIGVSGGSQPHNNIMPVLAVSFIISLFGIYPSRN